MSDTLPFISVVIPMRNESGWIQRCLGSVLAQDYPADRMEVLVADGMSDDGSRDQLERLAREDPRVRVIDNPDLFVPGGLNRAIRAARGDIIMRVDAHTVLEPDYAREGVAALERSQADNVGGPMVCRGGGPIADAIAAAMHSRFGIGAQFHFAREDAFCDTVYMGMWPRRALEKAGLFDEELIRNQDDELSYRIRKGGGRILVTPRMRSSYQNRESWRALARQFYQYGVWKVRVLQKHPRQMSLRHFIPPGYQLGLAAVTVTSFLGSGAVADLARVLTVLAAGGYAAALAVVAGREAPAGVSAAKLWLAFVIIHQAWAAGFLVGLVRFAPRWFQEEPGAPGLSARAGEPV